MIGWLAASLAGHDKKKIYIIIEETDDTVVLVDGECRPLDKPKIKKKKHIQVIKKTMDEELSKKIRNGELYSNEQIKRAIKLYKQNLDAKSM